MGSGAAGNAALGDANTALGAEALFKIISGFNNTAVGFQALFNNTLEAASDGALTSTINEGG